MRLENYPQKKLEQEIRAIVRKHLDLKNYQLFFFGSRVTGLGDKRSDIDVGIMGSKEVPLTAFWQIGDDLENLPTLYSIDLVDFSKTPKDFKDIALRKTEPIT